MACYGLSIRFDTRVGDLAAANSGELVYVPFCSPWRNHHTTDPNLRKVIRRAPIMRRANFN